MARVADAAKGSSPSWAWEVVVVGHHVRTREHATGLRRLHRPGTGEALGEEDRLFSDLSFSLNLSPCSDLQYLALV